MTEDRRNIDRAERLFRDEPEAAFSGSQLSSLEADPNVHSKPIVELVLMDNGERFLELAGYLPHALQDILFQHYLLGRTQEQIGSLLGMTQTQVWQALALSIRGICALIHFHGPPSGSEEKSELLSVWEEVLNFKVKSEQREELNVSVPRNLGEFTVSAGDVDLLEFFSPMATEGAVR